MSTQATPDRRKIPWEQHFQTILISIITGAILFGANYFYNDNKDKGQLAWQTKFLTDQILEMRTDIRSLQSSYAKREELRELEIRLRDVERKVR